MSNITFVGTGWDDYVCRQRQDKKTLKKINQLLTDIERNGNSGLGRPEPLKGSLTTWWSRAIDEKTASSTKSKTKASMFYNVAITTTTNKRTLT